MPVTLTAETADCPLDVRSVLLKPELSDVQISVLGSEKESKLFHAHKLVLAAASDAFKTMFFGSVPQENPVVVKDSTPAAFEAFLRFLYTGTTTIDEADVFTLLYLGKKYLVCSLVNVVMKHLEGCVAYETVGEIVLAAQNFLDDASPEFWESVERHGDALLNSDEFLQLRKDTVLALVQRELYAEEKLIYDKVVAWAKAECARNQLSADGETLRSALEGIVQHLRFSTMTAQEFVQGPAVEPILAAEEKIQVLRWFAGGIPQTLFPDTARYDAETHVCKRLTRSYGSWDTTGCTEAIDFSVSRMVRVTGLGAYNIFIDGLRTCSRYSIVAELCLDSVVLAKKEVTGSIPHASKQIQISFDKPVKIDASKRYTASVVVTGPSTYYGGNGTSITTVSTKKGDVVFNFVQSSSSANTNVAQGQIPEILFRV